MSAKQKGIYFSLARRRAWFSFVALLLISISAKSFAAIEHLSLNQYQSQPNQPLSLRLNFITEPNQALHNFRFVLYQKKPQSQLQSQHRGQEQSIQREVLSKHGLSDYLLELKSSQPLTDPQAYIRVYEHRLGYWFAVYRFDLMGKQITARKYAQNVEQDVEQKAKATQATTELTKNSPLNEQLKQGLLASTSTATASAAPVSVCTLEQAQGETLWRLSTRYAEQWQTNLYNAMLAIHDANLEAFAEQKIDKLKAKQRLICPDPALLARYPQLDLARLEYQKRTAK